jgi:hypothetical protein
MPMGRCRRAEQPSVFSVTVTAQSLTSVLYRVKPHYTVCYNRLCLSCTDKPLGQLRRDDSITCRKGACSAG